MELSIHAAAYDIENFSGDCLLAGLVIDESKLRYEVLSIVGCHLHGYGAGCMLCCRCIEHDCINLEFQDFWKKGADK